MPHHDNKLSRFEEAVLRKANQRRQAVIKEIDAMQAAEVRMAQEGILKSEARRVKGELSHLDEGFNRELAGKASEFRRRVLSRREEMTSSVFSAAREELLKFAASGRAYTDWMTKLIGELKETYPGNVTLFIKPADSAIASLLGESYGEGGSVTISEDFEIGGIILFNPDTGLIVDESLDSALNDQREYFLEHSGLTGQ